MQIRSNDGPTIIRLPSVKSKTGWSRSSIYSLMAQGKFPAPVSLGSRAVGWVESEIDQWIASRIAASRGGAQ
jgi:prophage regulatory protein